MKQPKDMTNEELWTQYHRFLYKIVCSLHKRFPRYLEKDEKVSIAWEGLTEAVNFYDPDHSSGACFMTYVKYSIKNTLLRAIYEEMRAERPCAKGKNFRSRTPYGVNIFIPFTEAYDSPIWNELHKKNCVYENPVDRIYFNRKVEEMLEGLTPEQADVFKLHFLEGLSFSQVGKELGISRETAWMRVQGVLKKYKALRSEPHMRKKGK